MHDEIYRAVDTVLAWAVAAALLFWPQLAARWRTALAVLANAAGVGFLIFAVNTEGLRETATVSVFLIGRGYVTESAEALASLPYYVFTGVCFLLGTTALAAPDGLAQRLREHWLAWAIGLSLATTALRFALEKAAAPQAWTQAVGITWAAPAVGAFIFFNVRHQRRPLLALVAALLAYGFASRAAVAALMATASSLQLGSHYDISALVRVANPFTREVYEFEPGSLHQIVSLGVLPQLGVWPFYTVLSGLIGAGLFLVLARLGAGPVRPKPLA